MWVSVRRSDLTKTLLLLLLSGISGACASAGPAPAGVQVAIEATDDAFVRADGSRIAHSGDLEAWGTGGAWLVWMQDDDPQLYVAPVDASGGQSTHRIESPLEAEAICLAPRGQGEAYDLFLGDGDGQLVHFWMRVDEGVQLQEVRRLWTNIDVEDCWIEGDSVVIDNGPLGLTAYAVDEEHDPILSAGRRSVLARTDDVPGVTAAFETEPVGSLGDAADDPAILVDGDITWIAGTDKRWGLRIYDLQGDEIHALDRGRLNNVDAVPTDFGFLLAASNRTQRSIDLFGASPAKDRFAFVTHIPITVNDPYGLCMGIRGDAVSIFVGGTDGEVQHWQVSPKGVEARQLETLNFESQTEGCVYDAESDHLYIGEEAVGAWQIDLGTGDRTLFAPVDDELVVADLEGLDICSANGERVLVGSSQGDDSYVVWPLSGAGETLKFRIVADPAMGLDGASETDGLACNNQPMPGYPRGLLVVQDGRNRAPGETQNFKAVDWRKIETRFNAR